ncbi:hypothetical protein [Nonomuraea cypriaca]|uniref:hypothetical protein n=1 Tax=Nonomuraea cypriaca TaxID=1187855 RepID=UPI001F16F6D9|nr:hypothetical protein [Nonomuraea cypriaca]
MNMSPRILAVGLAAALIPAAIAVPAAAGSGPIDDSTQVLSRLPISLCDSHIRVLHTAVDRLTPHPAVGCRNPPP